MMYPPHIQAMLDQGLAYETMDGCVQMCDAFLRGGYGLPTINIQINNTYNTYNNYNGNVYNGNIYHFNGDNATNNDIHENNRPTIY